MPVALSEKPESRLGGLENLSIARGEGIVTEFGININTAKFNTDKQPGPTVQHREPKPCGSLAPEGRMDTRVRTGLGPSAVHLKLPQ